MQKVEIAKQASGPLFECALIGQPDILRVSSKIDSRKQERMQIVALVLDSQFILHDLTNVVIQLLFYESK